MCAASQVYLRFYEDPTMTVSAFAEIHPVTLKRLRNNRISPLSVKREAVRDAIRHALTGPASISEIALKFFPRSVAPEATLHKYTKRTWARTPQECRESFRESSGRATRVDEYAF